MHPAPGEFRDGFLFLGNQLFLDFLNTKPRMDGTLVELLPDWPSLLRWMRAAGLLNGMQTEALTAPAPKVLAELLHLRETIRAAVEEMEHGRPFPPEAVAEVNGLLARYPSIDELQADGAHWHRRRRLDFRQPRDLIAPLADHAAALLAEAPPGRVRQCEQCVLHFLDTSKNGTRRWCSMALCGNRAKVRAYADRKRARS